MATTILGSGPRYALVAAFSEWLIGVPIVGSGVDAFLLCRRANIEDRVVTRDEVTNRIIFFVAGLFWCYAALFASNVGYVFATSIWVICSACMFSSVHPRKLDEEYGGLFLRGMVFDAVLFLPVLLNPYIPISWINFLGAPGSLLLGIPAYMLARLAVFVYKLLELKLIEERVNDLSTMHIANTSSIG
jgi:hypothetical protein